MGDSIGLLLAIGSVYGLARALFLGVFTHFWFDASVLGAYVGCLGSETPVDSNGARTLRRWIVALASLPFLLILLSPFVDAQPILVQLLGLRPAIFFLPLLLFGALMDRGEWLRTARWAAWTAVACGVLAVLELIFGIETFFPRNEASRLIYASQDVAGGQAFRIPSSFVSSHAYGGSMLGVIPLLVLRLDSPGESRLLTWGAMLAATFGVLITGARTPVVILLCLVLVALAWSIRRPQVAAGLVGLGLILAMIVPRFEQFRRVETLQDPELVSERIESSVNLSVLETVGTYPLGRGLASAFGTSIPYFLADEARPQLAIENEYARIALEEGILGLCLWLGFVAWALIRDPRRLELLGGLPDTLMWVLCVASWAQALIGTGMLASVPGTLILFTQMGAVAAQARRSPEPSPTGRWVWRST